jgi:hypothetical protein
MVLFQMLKAKKIQAFRPPIALNPLNFQTSQNS